MLDLDCNSARPLSNSSARDIQFTLTVVAFHSERVAIFHAFILADATLLLARPILATPITCLVASCNGLVLLDTITCP